jgi:hypothetical protein
LANALGSNGFAAAAKTIKGSSSLMNIRVRPYEGLLALALLALALLSSSLGGCASSNMGDYIPQWAGGLPADAPPRPGTAKYDEFMKERERNRQLPADQRNKPNPEDAQAAPAR